MASRTSEAESLPRWKRISMICRSRRLNPPKALTAVTPAEFLAPCWENSTSRRACEGSGEFRRFLALTFFHRSGGCAGLLDLTEIDAAVLVHRLVRRDYR